VKGVGEAAVFAIISEREKNGRYTGVFDFIERINLNACNKKTIESLALSGGFDEFSDIKRQQLFVENTKGELVIESIIRYGSKFQTDKSMTSNSLFGDMETIEIAKPEIPYAPEWSMLEKLNKERELIGMYLSSHPLDEFEFEMKHLCNTTTAELKELETLKGRSQIRIGGLITNIRYGTSKKGNPYGVFTLEDYDGAHEFALFGKNYIEFGKYMIKDLYVCISGVVQERGADFGYQTRIPNAPKELEFAIRQIDELANIKAKFLKSIVLTVSLQQLNDNFVETLTETIKTNKGNTNLYVEVLDEQSNDKVMLFARQHRLEMNKDVYQTLKRSKREGNLLDIEVKK
jgi:DNA polymerase-3 subunit alpha